MIVDGNVKGMLLAMALAMSGVASAQILVEGHEMLADDRPEAWAMNQATAASLLTAFGDSAPDAAHWRLTGELAQMPHFDDEERRVGFNGNKIEDLDKFPVFGRLRLLVGLGGGWTGELGWTPPIEHAGAKAEDLFAAAFGYRWMRGGSSTLQLRAFGQHGHVEGDFTCPADLAGDPSFETNPYGCQAPSHDRFAPDHYGLDLTGAMRRGPWQWHGTLGVIRNEAQMQVDALVYDARDRTRLVMRDTLPFIALGGRRVLSPRWNVAAELLHMPMDRRVGPGHPHEHQPGEEHVDDRPVDSDPYTGLRLQLSWDID